MGTGAAQHVRARAGVVAQVDGSGRTRLVGLRSEAPLVLRPTPDGLYLVGGAGGPLGGDDLTLEVEIGPGAGLTIRTAAASVALPGPGPSSIRVRAAVAAGGRLRWLPEPVVAAQGCRHRMEARVELEAGAGLLWREEVILGRHGEGAGSVLTRSAVDLDGAPVLRQELALGPEHPGAAGPAVSAGARAVGSVLVVDEAWAKAEPVLLGPTAAVLPLAAGALQVVALGGDATALRRQLDTGVRTCRAAPPGTDNP